MNQLAMRCLLILLCVLSIIRVSQLLPVQLKEAEQRPLPSAADSVTTPEVTPDPLENIGIELKEGFLIEGDIRVMYGLPSKDVQKSNDTESDAPALLRAHQTRNSVVGEDTWLEKVIPYQIDPTFNSTERQVILDAMNEIMAAVDNCTMFVERERQEDFLYITGQLLGCYSSGVGKLGGNQTISISRAAQCVTKGIVMHELLHALGFWHEHTRPDRDKYIEVLYQNVIIGHSKEFHVNKNGKMLVDYDYYSILHYKTVSFSKDRTILKTMRILQPGIDESEVGQRSYLSEKDKERIMILYQCRRPLTSSNLTHSSFRNSQENLLQTSAPGNADNVQNGVQALPGSTARTEHLASTVAIATGGNGTPFSHANLTETEEIGRK